MTYDPKLVNEVPSDVMDAAMLVDNWTKMKGFRRWKIGGLASRDYVEELEKGLDGIKNILKLIQ